MLGLSTAISAATFRPVRAPFPAPGCRAGFHHPQVGGHPGARSPGPPQSHTPGPKALARKPLSPRTILLHTKQNGPQPKPKTGPPSGSEMPNHHPRTVMLLNHENRFSHHPIPASCRCQQPTAPDGLRQPQHAANFSRGCSRFARRAGQRFLRGPTPGSEEVRGVGSERRLREWNPWLTTAHGAPRRILPYSLYMRASAIASIDKCAVVRRGPS
jgi:hypothetical protein